VAKALLTAADAAFRDSGMEVAALDVDTENPTGALQLYQGLGYEAVNRTALLATRFDPVGPR
jgi:ribosomal protein S18 acetylase RimI-like enzyme